MLQRNTNISVAYLANSLLWSTRLLVAKDQPQNPTLSLEMLVHQRMLGSQWEYQEHCTLHLSRLPIRIRDQLLSSIHWYQIRTTTLSTLSILSFRAIPLSPQIRHRKTKRILFPTILQCHKSLRPLSFLSRLALQIAAETLFRQQFQSR